MNLNSQARVIAALGDIDSDSDSEHFDVMKFAYWNPTARHEHNLGWKGKAGVHDECSPGTDACTAVGTRNCN